MNPPFQHFTRHAASAFLLALASTACIAATPADGTAQLRMRSLAASCAACHGTDGHAATADAAMAPLAGRDAAATASQLRAYRDGSQPATVMHQLAKGYSDAQIQALAAYFAAQR